MCAVAIQYICWFNSTEWVVIAVAPFCAVYFTIYRLYLGLVYMIYWNISLVISHLDFRTTVSSYAVLNQAQRARKLLYWYSSPNAGQWYAYRVSFTYSKMVACVFRWITFLSHLTASEKTRSRAWPHTGAAARIRTAGGGRRASPGWERRRVICCSLSSVYHLLFITGRYCYRVSARCFVACHSASSSTDSAWPTAIYLY